MTITVRKVAHAAPIEGLTALLIDAVHNGASVGFLAPLSPGVAAQYWERVTSTLGASVHLWVAESNGQVVGSVQIVACEKPNGRHRAEVQKLLVLTAFRGQRIASQLMSAVESFAGSIGLHLLVLDTEAGSVAETVYRRLGWQKAGEIPDYATTPSGKLHPTAYYFKFTTA